MAYTVVKNQNGRSYSYLVESYREKQPDGTTKIKQRVLKSLGLLQDFHQPNLPQSAPKAVVLFAGGGGWECGLVAAGVRPVCSVEFDPENPKLSEAIATTNEMNFKRYGHRVIRRTVEELAALGFPGVPRGIDFLHASPVCSRFSVANPSAEEGFEDTTAAQGTAIAGYTVNTFITGLAPHH